MNLLQRTNVEILQQLSELLQSLPTGVYHEPLGTLHQHSVGQHTRHIVEFYECLFQGLSGGQVNYDARERNLRLETDKAYTIRLIEDITTRLAAFSGTDTPLTLLQAFGTDEAPALPTSWWRELAYMIEHTIHHLAIIKIGLNQTYPDVVLPLHFGVAHSTIQFRNNQQTSA
jgi:uncharacterized damage-inducible protein DinB